MNRKTKYVITNAAGKVFTAEQAAQDAFNRMHPIESYDANPKEFCDWMRENGYDLTDEQISETINSIR